MEAATGTLISAGPLGAIIVILFIAYWRQSKALAEAQQARVADAQKVTTDLLELNEKWLVTLNSLTAAVHELRIAVSARSRREDL